MNQVSVNFDKSNFGKEEIVFLGHQISSEGIRPEISKIESFRYKQPKTKQQLQKLLGFINWFRPYIKNLSTRLSEFYDRLKTKGLKIRWLIEDDHKIKTILKEIQNQPLLHLFF